MMHVSGVSPGGAHPTPLVLTVSALAPVAAPAPTVTTTTGPALDSVGSSLEQMSSAPVSDLISRIGSSHPAADPAVAINLLDTAVSQIRDGNIPAAMATLSELVKANPERMETLGAEPSLSLVRAQVVDLLTRVTSDAKVEAEMRLATATQSVESTKGHTPRPGDWNPREVLPVAARLIESGRYPNILMATDLSQAVINYYGGFDIASPVSPSQLGRLNVPNQSIPVGQAQWTEAITAISGGVGELLKRMWRRSPILLLLFIWALLGLVSAIAAGIELWSVEISLEVWGAGSAGLIGYGTYRRLRPESSG